MPRKLIACVTLSLVATTAIGAADDVANMKDIQALAGIWKADSVTIDGKAQSKDETKNWTWTFNPKGNKYVFTNGKGAFTATFMVSAAKDPKEMDIVIATGPEKGKEMKGIYKLEGDMFTLCLPAKVGQDRPTEFTSTAGSGQRLLILKRKP